MKLVSIIMQMYTLVYQTKKTYHRKVREFDISRDNKSLALLSNNPWPSFLIRAFWLKRWK